MSTSFTVYIFVNYLKERKKQLGGVFAIKYFLLLLYITILYWFVIFDVCMFVCMKWAQNLPFFGSILNFFLPMLICLALLFCLHSSCPSRVSSSATTSPSSSFSCWKQRNRVQWRENTTEFIFLIISIQLNFFLHIMFVY